MQSPDQLASLLAGIGKVIDSGGGAFTMGYTAVVVTATLLAWTSLGD